MAVVYTFCFGLLLWLLFLPPNGRGLSRKEKQPPNPNPVVLDYIRYTRIWEFPKIAGTLLN